MRRRVNLSLLMTIVAVIAVGLGSMKSAAEWQVRLMGLASFVGLLTATVGSILRHQNREAWIGTAVFGWGYIFLLTAQVYVDKYATDGHDRPIYNLRIDDFTFAVAERMHPKVSFPADPFKGISTAHHTPSGPHFKIIGDESIPFNDQELKQYARYHSQLSSYYQREDSVAYASLIGLSIQGVVFALIGRIVGQVLSDRQATPIASAESQISQTYG